jgi:hypothetical protein
MDAPDPVVLPASFCGEDALTWLPSREGAPSEVCLEARGVTVIDAFGGAALRAQAEYHARYRQKDVVIGPPSEPSAWAIVHAMLEYDPPAHLVPWGRGVVSPGPTPRSILIPALPVRDEATADAVAAGLVRQAGAEFRTQLRFLGGHLPELIDNALRWGSSPIGAIVCAMHDRQRDELQLVVCDLGMSMVRDADAAQMLEEAITKAPEGSLRLLIEEAAARDLSARVSLATGPGRLRTSGTTWEQAGGSQVEGFAVSIVLPARL